MSCMRCSSAGLRLACPVCIAVLQTDDLVLLSYSDRSQLTVVTFGKPFSAEKKFEKLSSLDPKVDSTTLSLN